MKSWPNGKQQQLVGAPPVQKRCSFQQNYGRQTTSMYPWHVPRANHGWVCQGPLIYTLFTGQGSGVTARMTPPCAVNIGWTRGRACDKHKSKGCAQT